jgi:hypothetical protein
MKIVAFIAISLVASAAQAQLVGNLHLVQADTSTDNFANQIYGDFPQSSTGIGSIFTVEAGEVWSIDEVEQYLYTSASEWTSGKVTSGLLTVSKYTGYPTSNHNPTATSTGADIVFSGFVNLTMSPPSGRNFKMQAMVSGVPELQGLGEGMYLISVTPFGNFGAVRQAYTWASSDTSAFSFIRNPGGALNFPSSTGWNTISGAFATNLTQVGIGINGVSTQIPEPASMIALAFGAGAYIRPRRR